jgi:hypothetical protein
MAEVLGADGDAAGGVVTARDERPEDVEYRSMNGMRTWKDAQLNMPGGADMRRYLIEQMPELSGCPLCRATESDQLLLFASLLAPVRENPESILVEDLPFCNFHEVFFAKVGSTAACARLCQHLLSKCISIPFEVAAGQVPQCQVCEALAERQADWLLVLEELLNEEAHRVAYARGYGLCLPHCAAALTRFSSHEAIASIASSFRAQCERLMPDLDAIMAQGALLVPYTVRVSAKTAREKLFGCPGLTNYLGGLRSAPVDVT